jgi:hypothetical protein
VKECRGGHAPPLAIDNVDVDVDVDVVVDLVVDTTGHPLATDICTAVSAVHSARPVRAAS